MKEINEKSFMIHYLSITVHLSLEECIELYNQHFRLALFMLYDLHHGAKGFRGVKAGALGFQLKHTPGSGRNFCSFMFPGQACEVVPPEFFVYFYKTLIRQEIKFNVTRLDLAFDNVPFTPKDFYQIIKEDNKRIEQGEKQRVRTLTQRETVEFITQPFKDKEDGSGISRDTCYFGSRKSNRFIRVYNKRGPTRLEIELKGKRANLVASAILKEDVDNWLEISKAHLLDFIDIDIPWWKEFVGETERAYTKLYCPKDKSIEKKREWLLKQVSPTFAAVKEVTNGEIIFEMLDEGERRMYRNHPDLIALVRLMK